MNQNNSFHQVLSFANQNPACHLATTEGNQPHIRGMLMWFADETGFYFHTSSTKNLAKQIKNNPKVEIAFIKPSQNPNEMQAMRVCGVAEIIKNKSLEDRLFTERPWVNNFENARPDMELVLFRINNGEAFIWSMAQNLIEDKIERVKI